MTSHYIQTLGVAKCREILKGAPVTDMPIYYNLPNSVWVMTGYANRYFFDGSWKLLEETSLGDFKFKLIGIHQLRAELSAHDTDSCTDIRNHLSPITVVLENNLQEQFQEANEAGEGR